MVLIGAVETGLWTPLCPTALAPLFVCVPLCHGQVCSLGSCLGSYAKVTNDALALADLHLLHWLGRVAVDARRHGRAGYVGYPVDAGRPAASGMPLRSFSSPGLRRVAVRHVDSPGNGDCVMHCPLHRVSACVLCFWSILVCGCLTPANTESIQRVTCVCIPTAYRCTYQRACLLIHGPVHFPADVFLRCPTPAFLRVDFQPVPVFETHPLVLQQSPPHIAMPGPCALFSWPPLAVPAPPLPS